MKAWKTGRARIIGLSTQAELGWAGLPDHPSSAHSLREREGGNKKTGSSMQAKRRIFGLAAFLKGFSVNLRGGGRGEEEVAIKCKREVKIELEDSMHVCIEVALRGDAHGIGRSNLAKGRDPSGSWVQYPNPAVPSIPRHSR